MRLQCMCVAEALQVTAFLLLFFFPFLLVFLLFVMFLFSSSYFFFSFIRLLCSSLSSLVLFMFLAQFPKETEFTQTYHVCISPTVIILNVLANFKQI